jgi:hypothetical protein
MEGVQVDDTKDERKVLRFRSRKAVK